MLNFTIFKVCGDKFPNICDECDPGQCSGGGPPPSPSAPTPSTGGGSKCGCSSCTMSVLARDANGHAVGGRIDWVEANMGMSEVEAYSLGKIIHYARSYQRCNLLSSN